MARNFIFISWFPALGHQLARGLLGEQFGHPYSRIMASSVIPKTVNPDIQKERDGASFSSEEFAAWWAGGQDALKFNRELRKDHTTHS